jgi:hypothetical protein
MCPGVRLNGRPWNAAPRQTLLLASDLSRKGTAMKKIYERPTLVKRGRLTSVTAQIVASGIILGQ